MYFVDFNHANSLTLLLVPSGKLVNFYLSRFAYKGVPNLCYWFYSQQACF